MKRTLSRAATLAVLAGAIATSSLTAQAQTATFSNALGGDWNRAANWNPNGLPIEGTAALLTNVMGTYAVSYATPMAATSIGSLSMTNLGAGSVALNINANGFNVTGTILSRAGGRISVGSGGVVNTTTSQLLNSGHLVVGSGGGYPNSGTFGTSNAAAKVGAGAANNADGIFVSTTATIGQGGDGGPFVILGGITSLGNFSINRNGGGAGAPPAVMSGLIISNGA